MGEARFDVRVLGVPATTPGGEPFAPAVARAFGIPPATAERLVAEAPVYVKRGVPSDVATGMHGKLLELGADVEIVEASGSPAVAPISLAPGPVAVAVGSGTRVPVYVVPGPAASGSASEPPPAPAPAPSLALADLPPVAPAPLPPLAPASRAPLPPPEKGFTISPLWIAAGAVALLGLVWFVVGRVIVRTGDEKMLGNTPESETWCVNPYCLADTEKAGRLQGKRALVVAWRTGCLDDYREFLEGVSAKHRADISVVGVGLAMPTKKVMRGVPTVLSQPAPETFPPDGCEPAFDTLGRDEGYVVDRISQPVTYLLDEKGKLIALWRGGMSPEQRERLSTWLDGKAWGER